MKSVLKLLLILSVCILSCTDKKAEIRETYAKAVSEFYASRYEASIVLLDKVIAAGPDNAEALYYRGSANFNLKNTEQALKDIDEAIRLHPAYAEAHSTRGDIKELLGDHEEACACWRKAESLGKPNLRDKLRRCR